MRHHLHLNLDDLPWPINVLKFNQAIHDLGPGDDMTATITDGDVVGNLRQLLRCRTDLNVHVAQNHRDYRIRVVRPKSQP